MKTIKHSAIVALIVVCITTILLFIHSCNKRNNIVLVASKKYCVGKVTFVAPADNVELCENLSKGDMVCIPCSGSGCSGIWSGIRRTSVTSGCCDILVEITESNDCQTCPKTGKVLNTDTTKQLFWKFTKQE